MGVAFLRKVSKVTRQLKLLTFLSVQTTPVTLETLADHGSVSTKTISSDIDDLNVLLKLKNVEIVKGRGKGTYLKNPHGQNVSAISSEVLAKQDGIQDLSREYQIFQQLFILRRTVSYATLSETYFVSKTSITTLFKQFSETMKPFKICFTYSNQGTKVVGAESQIEEYVVNYVAQQCLLSADQRLKTLNIEILPYFFEVPVVNSVYQHFKAFDQLLRDPLKREYRLNLYLGLLVQSAMIAQKIHVEAHEDVLMNKLDDLQVYSLASSLVEPIERDLNLTFSTNDLDYLNSQLIAHGVSAAIDNGMVQEQYKRFVSESITQMSKIMHVDLTDDNQLYNGLLSHFPPMLTRLNLGISIKNPFLKQIKEQYSILYNATWYVFTAFFTDNQLLINESEISFLMTHFQAAIERLDQLTKVLYVSPERSTISDISYAKIRKIIPRNIILERINEEQFLNLTGRIRVNMIISAIALPATHNRVLKISALVTNEDLKMIAMAFLEIGEAKQSQLRLGRSPHISALVQQSQIFLNTTCMTQTEVIHQIVTPLLTKQMITENCEQSILQRELMGSTAVDNMVAIPHAEASEVIESSLSIMTLVKPIDWGGREVRTIFLFCFSKKDMSAIKGVLDDLYLIIKHPECIEQLLNLKEPMVLLKMLRG